MKNIYKFLILIFAIGIASCKDKDTDESVNALSVIESDVSFPASGGNDGYIKVNLPDGYTATSAQSWCTVSVDKDVVNVSATANPGLGSRAALITLTCGNQKEEVSVYQYGALLSTDKEILFFQSTDGPENPQTVNVSTNSTPTVTVPDTCTWLTATLEGNVLTVYCNGATEEKRAATITLAAGEAVAVITVRQNGPYEDYIGEWTLTGTDYATGVDVTYPNVKITQKVEGVSYNVEGWALNATMAAQQFEMLYDPATRGISISGTQQTGTYTTSYTLHLVGMVSNNNNATSVVTGNYIAVKGVLSQGRTINLEYQEITAGGVVRKFVGVVFRLRTTAGLALWLTFTNDTYVPTNAVLTKN
jgi:hypothetical protein